MLIVFLLFVYALVTVEKLSTTKSVHPRTPWDFESHIATHWRLGLHLPGFQNFAHFDHPEVQYQTRGFWKPTWRGC